MSTSSATSPAASGGWPVFGKLADSLTELKGFMRFCGILSLGLLVLLGILGSAGIASSWPTGLVWVLIGMIATFLVFSLAGLGCAVLVILLEYRAPVLLDTLQQKQDLGLFALTLFALELRSDERVSEYQRKRGEWELQFSKALNKKFEDARANLRADLQIDLNGVNLPEETRAKVIRDLEGGLGRLQEDFLAAITELFHLREQGSGGVLARACQKNAGEIEQYIDRLRDIVMRLPIRSGV